VQWENARCTQRKLIGTTAKRAEPDMKDLAYAFTIFFVTLGPIKVVAPFFLLTRGKDQRTILILAFKSTIVASAVPLFVALAVVSTMQRWRVSVDAIAISGGILLLVTSIKAISNFTLIDIPSNVSEPDEAGPDASCSRPSAAKISWLGKPVLSPIAIPTIITPIGVVAILCFSDAAVGDYAYKFDLLGVLLSIMALNFIAMVLARPIMRVVGVPIIQTFGWVLTALQAGLAVQLIIAALRHLHIIA
jgi:multiple antibiotic resistance protein